MNSRNTTKMVEHKLVLFATVIVLWTLVTLLIKLFCILLKWKYIQDQNYAILALFCLKCFIPITGLECSYGKIFIPVTEISVTRPARPLIYEHIDIFTKKRVARRDLGNRANSVDRAHMKRPLGTDETIIFLRGEIRGGDGQKILHGKN